MVRFTSRALGVLASTAFLFSLTSGEPAYSQDTQHEIIAVLGFPCGLNTFAKNLCAGFEAAEKELPAGFTFQLKSGVDFTDTAALNGLIENSIELKPSGLIIFPNGIAAQVPVLKKACANGIKVILIDNAVEGLGECQSSFIATDSYKMGVQLGEWLIAHPPTSKEVGIVTLSPGQFASNDARVKGFSETIEASGYKVAATVVADSSMDKTRTLVTNMMTAHPNIGAVMSSSEPTNKGTLLAIADPTIVQLTIDGLADSAERIQAGELRGDAMQNPYDEARLSVVHMAALLEGKAIPSNIAPPTVVLDSSNVQAFIDGGVSAIAGPAQ
jgi:ribose transport system substrate-binding protein